MSLVLVEGQSDVVYHLMLPTNPLTELLVSRLVQTSVRLEKALLQKSLRASKIFPAADPTLIFRSETQAKRGEEAEIDPEQFQDPDNEYGLFAGTTYEQDDQGANKIYDEVDQNMDSRRRARRCVLG
jgi:hypothetical protein